MARERSLSPIPALLGALACLAGRAASAQGEPSGGLVVVAPAAMRDALSDFVGFKQGRLPTELVALEDVLASSAGVDDPEKLKRFLHRAWSERRIRYALLVGDADVMPVRFMVLDRNTESAFDYAFYATDLYYGDVAKPDGTFDDWNANKEGFHAGYFGEVRGEHFKDDPINYDRVDYHAEIAVGRWTVSTAEEARLVAEKTIGYERALSSADRGPGRAALVNTKGWVDGRPLLDRMGAAIGSGWSVQRLYYAGGGRDDGTAPPDEEHVLALLQGGLDLLVHVGHGGSDAWHASLSARAIPSLTNRERLPVILSAGCSTAVFVANGPYEGYVDVRGQEHAGTNHGEVFDAPPPPPAPYQTGAHNPTSMGEELLRAGPDGAVAYVGCNTGGQPAALTLLEGFAESLGRRTAPRLGDCWLDAIEHFHVAERTSELVPTDGWYPPSIFYQPMKYMLFGDPSLALPAGAE